MWTKELRHSYSRCSVCWASPQTWYRIGLPSSPHRFGNLSAVSWQHHRPHFGLLTSGQWTSWMHEGVWVLSLMPLILESLGMAKEISSVGALLQLSPQPQQQGPQDVAKDATKKTWIHHQNGPIKAILAPINAILASAQNPWNGVVVVLF